MVLDNNCLSGGVDFLFLPHALLRCSLHQNDFRQEVVVFRRDRPKILNVSLDNSKFQSFVDTHGSEVPMHVVADEKIVALYID